MKRWLAALLSSIAGSAMPASLTIGPHHFSVSAYDYSGWAVCSLVFRGQQYLDAADHGRCLQSAASFDWLGEAFNPTEGGSVADGALPGASTTLLYAVLGGRDSFASEVQMAYWSGGRSRHVLRKWLKVRFGGRNVIEHRIAFEIPTGESHSIGQFEILTGYMPPRFGRFRTFDPATGALADLGDGPGEQILPVIFCSDDSNCMGAYSPAALAGGGYGRWRFPDVVKWNMVTRVPYPAGVFRFRVFTAVGTLAEVRSSIAWLRQTQQDPLLTPLKSAEIRD